jgi:hypothetical protein
MRVFADCTPIIDDSKEKSIVEWLQNNLEAKVSKNALKCVKFEVKKTEVRGQKMIVGIIFCE